MAPPFVGFAKQTEGKSDCSLRITFCSARALGISREGKLVVLRSVWPRQSMSAFGGKADIDHSDADLTRETE